MGQRHSKAGPAARSSSADPPFETREDPLKTESATPLLASGVSFVATSNAKALQQATSNDKALQQATSDATVLRRRQLIDMIEGSKTFKSAFGMSDRGRNRNPQDGPRPTLIQSSAQGVQFPVGCARWGLVSAIVDAYNKHLELVLRPDDVWQAILTQFSFYVNAHAEELRDRFVDFKGKKTLVVYMGGSLFTADYATFAQKMVDENIVENIKDPSVVEWLLPGFSTSTETDRVAASVTIMSTLQAYFEFVCCLCCGIPKVTLLGTLEDWRRLRAKVDRLLEYDLKDTRMTAWHALLAPVLDQLVASAAGNPDINFWDRVCSHHGGGSGPSYLSGWVTVFAVFTRKGEWQGSHPQDMHWPRIDMNYLPVGAVSVPVLVDDNGVQYDTQMVAGQFAYETIVDDHIAIRPRTDWCIAYEGETKAEPRAYKHGEIRVSG